LELLEQALPAALGGLAALTALAGAVWARWPSERALTLALAAFAVFWLLARVGGRVLLWSAKGRGRADEGRKAADVESERRAKGGGRP